MWAFNPRNLNVLPVPLGPGTMLGTPPAFASPAPTASFDAQVPPGEVQREPDPSLWVVLAPY